MPDPLTIAVSEPLLRKLLRLVEEGKSPKVHWSRSREKMDAAAMDRRGAILTEIGEELETLLPPDHP